MLMLLLLVVTVVLLIRVIVAERTHATLCHPTAKSNIMTKTMVLRHKTLGLVIRNP
jgi:hypothetical protein